MIVTDCQEELGIWLANRLGSTYASGTSICIGFKENGIIKSVASFENYNGKSVLGHLAIDDGRMNKEWAIYCFDYVFNQLKVNKLIGIVDSNNQKALRLDTHFGYIEECIIKDAGKDGNLHILSMTKEQCKMLNK